MPSLSACLVIVVALALAGCTHSRPLEPASPESRTHVNARAEGESALVTLHDGEEAHARSLHVAPDVTTWLDPDTGEMRSVPTSDLAFVRFTDRGRGVLEGTGIGTAIGFAFGVGVGAGAYLGLEENDDGSNLGFIQVSPAGGVLIVGAGFGLIGLLIGGIAGVDRGSYTVYALPASVRD
jgi:hypothetical protein